jgi:hypothetical protein
MTGVHATIRTFIKGANKNADWYHVYHVRICRLVELLLTTVYGLLSSTHNMQHSFDSCTLCPPCSLFSFITYMSQVNVPLRMTGISKAVNTHGYKYDPMRPKIP